MGKRYLFTSQVTAYVMFYAMSNSQGDVLLLERIWYADVLLK